MSENQDVFLIIRNKRAEQSDESQPCLKRRKPTVHSWSDQQHLQYLKFFSQNSQFVQSQILRKTNKIFVKMTEYILTRTSIQIKSHHQKLIKKFKTIPTILQQLCRYLNIDQKNKPKLIRKATQQTCAKEYSKQSEVDSLSSFEQNLQKMISTSRSSAICECEEVNWDLFNVLEDLPSQILLKIPGY